MYITRTSVHFKIIEIEIELILNCSEFSDMKSYIGTLITLVSVKDRNSSWGKV